VTAQGDPATEKVPGKAPPVREAGRRRSKARSCGAFDQFLQRGPADQLDRVAVEPDLLRLALLLLIAVARDGRDQRLLQGGRRRRDGSCLDFRRRLAAAEGN
jgi:hypothetical protein